MQYGNSDLLDAIRSRLNETSEAAAAMRYESFTTFITTTGAGENTK